MTDFRALLAALVEGQVEFIVVGGLAATAHGSARLTLDLDVVYRRTPENLRRIVSALAPHKPYLRGAPPGLPFQWEETTLQHGLNFTLTTSLGSIDLLGEITGGGRYDDLFPHGCVVTMFSLNCPTLSLQKLIEVKRAAGRPKDLEVIAELEAIEEEGGEAAE